MSQSSPLLPGFRALGAIVSHYGPAEAGVEVVQAFEPLDLEYAAVRRSCGLIDLRQRATLEVRGKDRHDFLNRMLTQELKGAAAYSSTRSFWLSRQGRIEADLRVLFMPDRVLLDVDVHAAGACAKSLNAYVISEEVEIVDVTDAWHRLAIHGPAARALVDRCSSAASGDALQALTPGRASVVSMAGAEVIVDRADETGEIGLHLLVPTPAVVGVYRALLEGGGFRRERASDGPIAHTLTRGAALERGGGGAPALVRPIGWGAYNVARIEAGTALQFLDFGPTNLPHESGVLDSRVSFTKGCYLGQEIVARMQSLGAPKQRLVGLRIGRGGDASGSAPAGTEAFEMPVVPQPVTGSMLFAGEAAREPIGAVTSSAISPMLGGVAICLAMVKQAHSAPGTALLVECEGTRLPATVQPGLAFWRRKA